jgi:hypothetical protein
VSLVARVVSQRRDQSGDCCPGSQPLFLSPPLLHLRAATAALPSIAPGISGIIHSGQDMSTPHRCLRRRSSTSRSRSRQRRCDRGGQLRRVCAFHFVWFLAQSPLIALKPLYVVPYWSLSVAHAYPSAPGRCATQLWEVLVSTWPPWRSHQQSLRISSSSSRTVRRQTECTMGELLFIGRRSPRVGAPRCPSACLGIVPGAAHLEWCLFRWCLLG